MVDHVVKRFFAGNQCAQAIKFVDLGVSGMQAAVLLRSAMNKLEAYGADPAARIQKDKGSTLLSTIRTTRTRFAEACQKFADIQEQVKEKLPESDCDKLVAGLRSLYEFDMPGSFGHSDLIKNVMYADIISHKILLVQEEIREAGGFVKPLLRNMQNGGENDWKSGLDQGCSIKELEAQAKKTLDSLNGTELRSATKKLIQATW